MSVVADRVTVSTSAVALNADVDAAVGTKIWLRNTDATGGIALGGVGVTAATGFRVAGGLTVGPIELNGGEILYAVRTGLADVVVDLLRSSS